MNTLNTWILTLVTFIPLFGAVLLFLFPRRDRDIRVFAFVISLFTFVLSLHLPSHFAHGAAGFQFEMDVPWISTPNIHYHLGIDGVSMWLVVLTTFLTPRSWRTTVAAAPFGAAAPRAYRLSGWQAVARDR